LSIAIYTFKNSTAHVHTKCTEHVDHAQVYPTYAIALRLAAWEIIVQIAGMFRLTVY